MIDLELEKTRKLTTEQITMILDFATQAANDEGFMTKFVFDRAVMVFAAISLYPERKEEISGVIGTNYDIRLAFDALVADGTFDRMCKDFSLDVDNLLEIGDTWYEEAKTFEHSARGVISTVSNLSGSITQAAFEKLSQVASNGGDDILEFAKKYGYGNSGATKAITPEQVDGVLSAIKANPEE